MARDPRYSLIQRLIHWAVAVIALCVLAAGLTLGALGFDGAKNAFGLDATNLIYKYHKTFGVVILALMTIRLVVRLSAGRPDYHPPIAGWQRSASASVHGLVYVLLLTQPILGWAATAAGGYPIEFFNWNLPKLIGKDPALSETLYSIHGAVGLAILALVVVHVSAALMHWLFLRDNVMRRMSLF